MAWAARPARRWRSTRQRNRRRRRTGAPPAPARTATAAGMAAGAGADQDQAIDAGLQRALGVHHVGHVMEHQAAVTLGRFTPRRRAQRGDLIGTLCSRSRSMSCSRRSLRTVHDLVDRERATFASGCLALYSAARLICVQPVLEQFRRPRVQCRKGADNARLALGGHQVRTGTMNSGAPTTGIERELRSRPGRATISLLEILFHSAIALAQVRVRQPITPRSLREGCGRRVQRPLVSRAGLHAVDEVLELGKLPAKPKRASAARSGSSSACRPGRQIRCQRTIRVGCSSLSRKAKWLFDLRAEQGLVGAG